MKNLNLFPIKVTTENTLSSTRSCGECTKCCEGYLEGEAYGHKFFKGKPCYFLSKNGCSIYKDRPENPCINYKCYWLVEKAIPHYMRPDKSKVILTQRHYNGFDYLAACEAGSKIDSEILSEIIQYCFTNKINLEYEINGKFFQLGSDDFITSARQEIKRKLSNKL